MPWKLKYQAKRRGRLDAQRHIAGKRYGRDGNNPYWFNTQRDAHSAWAHAYLNECRRLRTREITT